MTTARVRQIGQLPVAGALDGTEVIPVSQQGAAAVLTAQRLADYIRGTLPPPMSAQSRSFLDMFPLSVKNAYLAGASIDLTPHIQNALNSGLDLFMPANLPTVTTTAYLLQNAPRQRVVWSRSTKLIYSAPVGSPITPIWIIGAAADDAELWNPNFDHNAIGSRYINPTIGGGNLALGTAVLLMGERCKLVGGSIVNGWDNGWGIGRYGLGTTNVQSPGLPRSAQAVSVYTENCGCGFHLPNGEEAGAGGNFLTGSAATAIGCVDKFSRYGFITDYAAGGGGSFIACTTMNNRKSAIGHLGNFGGGGFYFLGPDTRAIGCAAFDCAGDGLTVDGYATGTFVSIFRAKGCGGRGALLQGNNTTLSDALFDLCSYNNANAYDAVEVIGTQDNGAGGFTSSTGMSLSNVKTSGSFHRLGLNVHNGAGEVLGRADGMLLNGLTGPYQSTCPNFIVDYVAGNDGSRRVIAPDGPVRIGKHTWDKPTLFGAVGANAEYRWTVDGKSWVKVGSPPTNSADGKQIYP